MWTFVIGLALGAELTPHLSYLVGEEIQPAVGVPMVVGTWSPRCDTCDASWRQLEAASRRDPSIDVLALTDDQTLWVLPHIRRLSPSFSVAVDASHRLSRNLRSGQCGTGGWGQLHVIVDGRVVWSGSKGLQRALSRVRRGVVEDQGSSSATCLGFFAPEPDLGAPVEFLAGVDDR